MDETGLKAGAQKPVGEDEGEDGLGSKTGGEGGPERSGLDSLAGGGSETGPTQDAESVPGGGDDLGPTPSGAPQQGGVDSDPDTATGSTESGPNPAKDD
jgi:hypothetical protein